MGAYEYLAAGFVDEPGYNCCERMLIAGNRAYGLELGPESIKLAAGFGGGMAVGSVCGALTGGVMVLSSLFVAARAHDDPRIRSLTARFLKLYEQRMGAMDCRTLKAGYFTPEGRCRDIILEAAKALDQVVAEAGKEAKG